MKKNFLLTLLLVFSSALQCWAEFNPTVGKMYALKEVTSGLYLDIQTMGINEPGGHGLTTNNISLNSNPYAIYFETSNGNWKMKNVNGGYVYIFDKAGSDGKVRSWNSSISTGDKSSEWRFNEVETNIFTISRTTDNKFINSDDKESGKPLYCDKNTGMQFILESVCKDITGRGAEGTINVKDINGCGWSNVVAGTGWIISMDIENPNGASYNEYGTSLFAIGNNAFPEKNGYRGLQFYLQSSTNGGKLNAVFDGGDHQITNVTYTGNFSAAITYNGGKHLQIKTTNASGTVAINDYTLNNALAEFSQFAYGLPSGLNVKNLQIAPLSNSVDYPTTASVSNNKYTFTSGKILYSGECNKIRFTLTESGAYYEKGRNRMSFDSFVLFDAAGKTVTLKSSYFEGNNSGKVFDNMLDGVNGTYCAGGYRSGTEDDWFEITLPNSIDLGGAFSFSYVTENTTMNAKAFNIAMSYEEQANYTFNISGNGSNDVVVTYNGDPLTIGSTIEIAAFDVELLSATNISGYTWDIVVDDENLTITLVYTACEILENPQAVVDLVNRIGGAGTANKFKFVHDPSLNSKQETFILGAEDGKILIKGSSISAITTGIGWYLNNVAKINIAWNSLNEKTVAVKEYGAAYADLSNLPLPTTTETYTSDAKYRYYLNTCTFGYSMTSWTWTRWQQEIDWMALHGINMPLQLVGMEEVWRKFLTMEDGKGNRKYGYSDEEAKAFVAGPAFIAWWAMNNLEGWGGTAAGSKSGYNNLTGAGGVQDEAWYARQKELAGKIVSAQRALGMQPVLPGWSGMVPTNFQPKSTYTTRGNGGNWAGDFVRPLLLSVGNANYAEIAADYYTCLEEVMGESQYYSMDPFHEGGGAGTMEDYEALYAAMEAAKPGSQWVIQQWQWSATQKYSLTAVPEGRLIVLDLFSDGSPAFDAYNGYAPQDAVFCAIPNFGGRSGLMGRLQNVTDNYFKFKQKYKSIKGIGTAPEAIEQTPVTYDLIYQLPWLNGEKPNVADWVANYSVARYGQDNAVVKEAWDLLRQGPLNYGADGIQGPVEDVWAARPNLNANKASSWGKTLADAGGTYTPARRQMLIDAVYKLIDQEEKLDLVDGSVYKSNYLYDLVEFGGAVMADYAYDLLLGIKAAKNAEGTSGATYIARRDGFLQLILDMDAFRGTNLNFRLGKWTQEARDAAKEVEGATTATPDWYEYNNARTILTTWSSPGTNLTDYSYRSWQGLLKDYYYPRWKSYFDNNCTDAEYKFFEWNWAHGMTHKVGDSGISSTPLVKGQAGHTDSYTRNPEGNTVVEATKLLDKYIIPIKVNGKSKYAYRYLENDFTASVIIGVSPSSTANLTKYLGNLGNITLVCENAVAGSATDLSAVAITGVEGSYPAILTLADKTIIKFTLRINSSRDAAEQELQELVADMTALINKCGNVNVELLKEEIPFSLQTQTPTSEYYLSSNADQNVVGNKKDGDGIAALIDSNVGTYMHTQWGGTAVGAIHHVQVNNIKNLQKFTFTYATRKGTSSNETSPAPTIIKVYGSTDGNDFTDLLATFQRTDENNPLLHYSQLGEYWTSVDLEPTKSYNHLRFCVPESDGPGTEQYGGNYFFAMSEFVLSAITTDYSATAVVGANSGDVTEEQLVIAAVANEFAKELADSYVDQPESELRAKKAELQELYEALFVAYNASNSEVLLAAKEARAFLDETPTTAGYPSDAKRAEFLAVIDALESVEAINTARSAFVATTDVYMPEDGKAYVIRNVHPDGTMYMLTNEYEGTNPKLPTATANPEEDNANIFICREVNGGYVFVNASHGKYMLFHGKSGNYPLSEDGFSKLYSTDNILKLNSQAAKRFGTLSIAGLRIDWKTSDKAYGTMTINKDGSMDANGGENNAAYGDPWSSLFLFEQVENVKYSVNVPKHTPISSSDVLLQGILENQTISTFSAPYATVMPVGVTAYYAKKAIVGETLYLTALEKGKALPANEGVILVGEVGTKTTTILPATTEEVAVIDNVFANSATAPVEMGDNDYILSKGMDGIGIYKAQKGLSLAAGKAFLRFEVGASAPKFIVSIEKGPTSVRETLIDNPTQQVIYDLGGRRVNEISKGGFYIVNGKKMFVK